MKAIYYIALLALVAVVAQAEYLAFLSRTPCQEDRSECRLEVDPCADCGVYPLCSSYKDFYFPVKTCTTGVMSGVWSYIDFNTTHISFYNHVTKEDCQANTNDEDLAISSNSDSRLDVCVNGNVMSDGPSSGTYYMTKIVEALPSEVDSHSYYIQTFYSEADCAVPSYTEFVQHYRNTAYLNCTTEDNQAVLTSLSFDSDRIPQILQTGSNQLGRVGACESSYRIVECVTSGSINAIVSMAVLAVSALVVLF